MSEHTKGLLATFEAGNNGNLALGSEDKTSLLTIVDEDGTDFAALYHAADAKRLAACWNLLHEFDTEAIEAGTFADFIGQQVYQHEIENANSGELRLSDVSMQLMAAGFAGKMKANAAENYMEFGLFHPETGHITLTVQRAEGLTPAQKLAAMTKQRDELLAARDMLRWARGYVEYAALAGFDMDNNDVIEAVERLPELDALLSGHVPEPVVPKIEWVAVAEAVIEDHVVTEWDYGRQEVSGYRCGYCSLSDDTSDGVVNGGHDPDCVITKARAMLAAAPAAPKLEGGAA